MEVPGWEDYLGDSDPQPRPCSHPQPFLCRGIRLWAYRDNKTVDADGHFEHHPVRLPDKNDWKVFLPDHHPAYITWEEFEENQNRLGSNRTNTERCGPAREGAALLTGILICGKCGRRMTVRYTGTGGIRPLYECVGRWEHGNKATCSSVPAETLTMQSPEKSSLS